MYMENKQMNEMGKTKVVNKYHDEPYDVYIGRGSKWGNPFTHKQGTKAKFVVGSRDEAVAAFREWILTQPQLLADLHELKGKTLACFCAPKACHGHVLAELADSLDIQTKTTIRIGFTGHRPTKLGGYNLQTTEYNRLQQDLEWYIERNLAVYETVIGHSCLAQGGDTIWSKAILAMKDKYPGRVQLHAEIPFMEQPDVWPNQDDINFWHEQVQRADDKTIYGSLANVTGAARRAMAIDLLNKGNIGIIEHVDIMLALYNGSKSGTGHAIREAEKQNVPVYVVHPDIYFKR